MQEEFEAKAKEAKKARKKGADDAAEAGGLSWAGLRRACLSALDSLNALDGALDGLARRRRSPAREPGNRAGGAHRRAAARRRPAGNTAAAAEHHLPDPAGDRRQQRRGQLRLHRFGHAGALLETLELGNLPLYITLH